MLKITIALLMILCLSGCQTTVERQLICKQIKGHQIKPVVSCDISFEFDRCRCRCFDFNSWARLDLNQCPGLSPVEPRAKVLDFPLTHCEGISGFFLKEIASDIRPNVKALYQIKRNLCGE